MIPVGTHIGNYRVAEWLGVGGMGDVYRATDVMLERDVALKFVRPELAGTPSVLERFRTEGVLLAKLRHPQVAAVHGLHRHGDALMMVMEFVPGETLEQLMRRQGRVPSARAVDIARQVAQALEHAHALGIVHRDIKPANVMIDAAGRVKVLDFGIATALGADRRTRAGFAVGTVGYMAPEQVQGLDADGRSDIYALGVVLYEMLTGRPLFAGATDYAVMHAQIQQPPDAPSRYADVSPALDRLVVRMLAKDRGSRPCTAGDVDRELADIRPVSPKGATPARSTSTWRSYAVATGVAGLVVAALANIGAVVRTPVAAEPSVVGGSSRAVAQPAPFPPSDIESPFGQPDIERIVAPEGGEKPTQTAEAGTARREAAGHTRRVVPPTLPVAPMPLDPAPTPTVIASSVQETSSTVSDSLELPPGTRINVVLATPLNTATIRIEDRVEARVVGPVAVNGRTAIDAGARLVGAVRTVKAPGRLKGRASVTLVFEALIDDGTSYRLAVAPLTLTAGPGTARDAATIGAAAGVGGAIGGAADGRRGGGIGAGVGAVVGVLRRGKHLDLESGHPLAVQLAGPLSVRARREVSAH